jgi:maleylacetate reductase
MSVPTTLSGGEFNPLGGCTDHRRKVKQSYTHPDLIPVSVVLDPAPTVHTPEWLWLSTGMRAVDHCVEGLCSQYLNPYAEGALLHGLKLLAQGLAAVKADPSDLDARLQCQIGAWMSMTGNIPKGLSHAIGHILGGTCNVPHGYTSCVMLPAALAWNESVNRDRQALVAEAMGRPGERASDVLADFIAGLGLPRSLGAVEVGEDQFDLIAKNTMHDRWTHTNPRKVSGPEDIKEVLRLAV